MKFKNLERYRTGGTSSKMQLSVPLPTTPDGRVYRFSPNEHAHPRHFVLGGADESFVITDEARRRMKLPPRSKQTVCPYSGIIADDEQFTHPEDLKAATKIVEQAAFADVQDAFHDMFRNLERQFSSSKFLKIKTTGRPSTKPKPRFARRDLLRELICDHCGRDYGVFAIGLFCPDCGAPNLRLHFAREVELVLKQVGLADSQQGQEELAYRLMGNAHEDVLTAFEATQKAAYLYGIAQLGATPSKPVKNDFQNVEFAQRRFSELNIDPFSTLIPAELTALKLNIQKRHIIGHNLGVMDEKFADHAASARLGETVHLVGEDIAQFALLAQRVVESLDTWLAGGVPAPVGADPTTKPAPSMQLQSADEKDVVTNLEISPLAARVAKWIAEQSNNGLGEFANRDALMKAFAETEIRELAEAIAELAMEGYLLKSLTTGHVLPHMRPTPDLFATFDPLAEIGHPISDSVELIERILASGDSVNTASLHEATGWPLRRFNPAIALVIGQIGENRVSKTSDNQYPARSFHMIADDRVALKRYTANRKQ